MKIYFREFPDLRDATLRSILGQLREKREEWTQVPCSTDICDSRGRRIYGCCRPIGHDGPHETQEDRHARKYPFIPNYDGNACADALLPIISEIEGALGEKT